MLGKHHLLLSLSTYVFLCFPVFTDYPILLTCGGFAVCLGSVLPDVDSEDATIFHHTVIDQDGETATIAGKAFSVVSILFPYFGYPVKYLIYEPTRWVYNMLLPVEVSREHRGYTHGHLGIWTISTLTMAPLAWAAVTTGVADWPIILSAFTGLLSGMYLHVLQDSCTKSGVSWKYPFSQTKLSGTHDISARGGLVHPHSVLTTVLITLIAASAFVSVQYSVPVYVTIGANLIIGVLTWFVFVFGISSASYE